MDASAKLARYIRRHKPPIGKVVDYDTTKDKLFPFDFTAANTGLDSETVANTPKFSVWVNQQLTDNNARYGIGGYMEHRTLYARSAHFDTDGEPRRLHLGIDIWAKVGTPVYSPLPATIHSYHDNDNFGDYGATIILMNHLVGFPLYSLYGHLSRKSLEGLYVGKPVEINQKVGELGDETDNGNWPPHLHYQLMLDIGDARGDYPGVGQYSRKSEFKKNIADPNLLLKFSI